MNLRKLTDTILKEGGISYSLTYGIIGGKGYAVSVPGFEVQIPVSEFTNTDLQNYINENAVEFATDNRKFLGAWVEDGNVYLDVSIRVNQKVSAIALAKCWKQKAIFDFTNNETIWL